MNAASTSDTRRTVLITGVTRENSLGSALALAFLDIGWRVFATSQAPTSQASWLEKKGCELLELELLDDASIVRAAGEVKLRSGGVLDVLVNNASHLSRAPLLTTPIESLRDDYQVNVIGTIRLTQLLAPLLVHTAARSDRGRTVIFNVGTAGSQSHVPYWAAQLSTKSALESLSEILRYEMQNLNVAVYYAKLGYIKTDIAEGESNPFDHDSPNAAFYPDFLSKTLKQTQAVTNGRYEAGSDPHEAARWIVGLCIRGGRGGIVWHASKAWILRWLFPILPTWAMDRLLTARGVVDSVEPPHASKMG